MYPHERSLVQKYQGKHFKIVGINSDPEGKLATLYANKTISWPCFYDGGSQMGPIATKWNVHGWPTVYLLDAHGRIRYLQNMEQDLDAHIATLVNEAEQEAH